MYGIGVRFKDFNNWSKIYVYKSLQEIPKDSIVLVPKDDFYNVGKVVGCKENYEFKLDISYKSIMMIINIKEK